ncbi:MAG: hypothetical protein AAGF28_12045 [Pseudomonadota bacterium]
MPTKHYNVSCAAALKDHAHAKRVISVLVDRIENTDLNERIAFALLSIVLSEARGVKQNWLHDDIVQFYSENFAEHLDGDFPDKPSFLRYAKRGSVFMGHLRDRQQMLSCQAVIALYLLSASEVEPLKPILRDSNFAAATDPSGALLSELSAIAENPDAVKKLVADQEMALLGKVTDVFTEVFKIPSIDNAFVIAKLFPDLQAQLNKGLSKVERHFACFRWGAKERDSHEPYILKSHLILIAGASNRVRFVHFYCDQNDNLRRTNGIVLEIEDTIYMLGVPAKNGENQAPGSALGIKVMAVEKHQIKTNDDCFTMLVLSNDRSKQTIVGRLAAVSSNLELATQDEIGRRTLRHIYEEEIEEYGCEFDLEKMLNVEDIRYAIRTTD